jgi:hypothetical protein
VAILESSEAESSVSSASGPLAIRFEVVGVPGLR